LFSPAAWQGKVYLSPPKTPGLEADNDSARVNLGLNLIHPQGSIFIRAKDQSHATSRKIAGSKLAEAASTGVGVGI
jgi:hypothetical protein